MIFMHVCCVGASNEKFRIVGIRYRSEDAATVLAHFSLDPANAVGFEQIWSVDLDRSELIDTRFSWDKQPIRGRRP